LTGGRRAGAAEQLGGCSPHSLHRPVRATHLLANGVRPEIAHEQLGHSSVGILSPLLPGVQAHSVAKLDAAVRGAIED
jgi:hypothetical protein